MQEDCVIPELCFLVFGECRCEFDQCFLHKTASRPDDDKDACIDQDDQGLMSPQSSTRFLSETPPTCPKENIHPGNMQAHRKRTCEHFKQDKAARSGKNPCRHLEREFEGQQTSQTVEQEQDPVLPNIQPPVGSSPCQLPMPQAIAKFQSCPDPAIVRWIIRHSIKCGKVCYEARMEHVLATLTKEGVKLSILSWLKEEMPALEQEDGIRNLGPAMLGMLIYHPPAHRKLERMRWLGVRSDELLFTCLARALGCAVELCVVTDSYDANKISWSVSLHCPHCDRMEQVSHEAVGLKVRGDLLGVSSCGSGFCRWEKNGPKNKAWQNVKLQLAADGDGGVSSCLEYRLCNTCYSNYKRGKKPCSQSARQRREDSLDKLIEQKIVKTRGEIKRWPGPCQTTSQN
ncbi:hypothetical protein GUITHDRAFT_138075 [Guillardia theta CCMP2712]|uniref:Uncharacterized protein n=1 Tax=Guillardia theta (strain CCMP2712) TaxID=905079 RepID=L1JEH3_GUITC|nr:hypothetical protein GUITHDRAFT_138075 [Guillardia theta CCMP2712]EKX46707.1 hypothetical protein GUITHDRAFT_138075 [Guillardia theta CCMP2712]|eukprot:XP_005833687.1 hypothetical protein GUITHDRAFT_138075 [Guillardia theta CCMP2712]